MSKQFWADEINRASKIEDSWLKEAKRLNGLYTSQSSEGSVENNKSYNIFYSNTEVLRGAIKISNPTPDIRRRWSKMDAENKLTENLYLKTADIVEKTVSYFIDRNKIADVFDLVNKDALISGRGVAWLEYESEVETDDDDAPLSVQEQEFRIVYVNFEDFRCSPVRTDGEITWVARKHLLTKEMAEEAFDEKTASSLQYETDYLDENKKIESGVKKCVVWEIWDKESEKRIYYSPSSNELIKEEEDPYKLCEFFPCGVLRYIKNSLTTVPSPEFSLYKNKAMELENVCNRRSRIVEASKLNGLISSRISKEMTNLSEADDGKYLPVDGVATEIGSLIWERDLGQAGEMLQQLTGYEETLKSEIYDLTGISDIMRGSSDPQSTATAESLKGKFGALRIVRRQEELQCLIRDMYQKMCEVICEHSTIDTLKEVSGVSLPTAQEKQAALIAMQNEALMAQNAQQPYDTTKMDELQNTPTWDEVSVLLKNDRMRSYTLSVETNITAFDDEAAQNESLDNLFAAFTNMVTQAATVVTQSPELLEPFREMILAKVRLSKAGRSVENAVESAFNKIAARLEQEAKEPQEAPVDQVKMMELQIKQQTEQAKLAQKTESDAQKNLIAEQKNQITAQNNAEKNRIAQEQLILDQSELSAEMALKQSAISQGIGSNTNLGA